MRALTWRGETAMGEDYAVEEIPADMQAKADEWREKLLETLSENDDTVMEKYLEGEELSEQEIKDGIRRATLAASVTPVLTGTAFKNKGVQPMLDAVIDFLPSPIDVEAVEGHKMGNEEESMTRKPSEDEPFSALAFKNMSDPHHGNQTYVRVYSATLQTGTQVLNSTKDRKERIGKIYRMHANKREEIDATDRIVIPGFVDVHTHYDAQVTWANHILPSSAIGVTTVLMGYCGVGFAPVRPDHHDMLISLMEGVEDIPEVVMKLSLIHI